MSPRTNKLLPLNRKTLKEAHVQRQLMLERIRRADERILAEHHAKILLEAIDKDELQKATKILTKLGTIKKAVDKEPGLSVLSDAIKQASSEVNEFTGGGLGAMMKRGVGALAKKFGLEAETNPILKSLTLLSTLETGFGQLSDIIKNNVPDYDPKGGPLSEQIEDEKTLKTVQKTIQKAFQPEGVFAKIKSLFGSSGGMPYVKEVNLFIAGLMEASGENLTAVVKAAASGGSAATVAGEAAQDMAQAGRGGKSSAPKKTGSPQTVKGEDDLAKAIAAGQSEEKNQDPGEALKAASDNPKKVTQQFIDFVSKKSGQKTDVVNKVVSALIKSGKLKTEFKVTEEARTRNVAVLTLRDVRDARKLYLESGGSSRKWVDLLTEDAVKQLNRQITNKVDQINSIGLLAAAVKGSKLFKDLDDQQKKNLLNKLGGNDKLMKKFNMKPDAFKTKFTEELQGETPEEGEKGPKQAQDAASEMADKSEELKNKVEELTKGKKLSDDMVASTFKTVIKMLKMQQEEMARYSPDRAKKLGGEIDKLASSKPSTMTLNDAITLNDKLAGQIAMDLKNEKYSNKMSADRLKDQIDAMRNGQEELVRLMDDLETEKGELEGKLASKSKEAEELAAQLEKDKKTSDAFKSNLAKALKIDPKDLESKIGDVGFEGLIAAAMAQKPEAVEQAADAAGVSTSGEDSGEGKKHEKTIAAIKDSLSDVEPSAIVAILDALPEYLMAEALRKRTLLESLRVQNRHAL